MLRLILRLGIFLLLTLLTQIGGVIYLLALGSGRLLPAKSFSSVQRCAATFLVGTLLYVVATVFIVPHVAAIFGRVRLSCSQSSSIITANSFTCWFNRGYVRSDVHSKLIALADEFQRANPGSRLTVLESGFPFIAGFPLLPHLSHHDGRKVDLAFFYRHRSGDFPIDSGSPSPIGYFVVEPPRASEVDACAGSFTPLRWSFWWINPEDRDWMLDEQRTAALLRMLKSSLHVTKLFVEPHLAKRLGVEGEKIRFQGCRAARHDDHIHVEFE